MYYCLQNQRIHIFCYTNKWKCSPSLSAWQINKGASPSSWWDAFKGSGLLLPAGLAKALSRPLSTGVAGREREAWAAVSIFSVSSVGELRADILLTSVFLSRTASSCRKSTKTFKVKEHFAALPPFRLRMRENRYLKWLEGSSSMLMSCDWQRGSLVKTWSIITSGFILKSLHREKKRLLLIQLALQEGVPLDREVHTLLEVLQRHDGSSEEEVKKTKQCWDWHFINSISSRGLLSVCL